MNLNINHDTTPEMINWIPANIISSSAKNQQISTTRIRSYSADIKLMSASIISSSAII